MENVFTHTIVVPGTLAANIKAVFTVPFDCQLIHVSAVGSNANNGILDVGTTTSAEAYLANMDIGDSYVPAEAGRSNFVGGQFPHLTDGTVVAVELDFDGAAGTAAQNFTCVLTFTKG